MNYGDFRQCAIPIPITCILQGTPCDTGIPYTFYGENICSILIRWENPTLHSITYVFFHFHAESFSQEEGGV